MRLGARLAGRPIIDEETVGVGHFLQRRRQIRAGRPERGSRQTPGRRRDIGPLGGKFRGREGGAAGLELELLNVAHEVNAVRRAGAQVRNGKEIVAFKADGIIIVAAVAVEAEAAREDHRVTTRCQGGAVGQCAAGKGDVAIAATVDDVVAGAGEDAIVAEPAIEDVIVEPTVDDVVADAADENIRLTDAATAPAANRIAGQGKANGIQGNGRAVGVRARVEDLRGDVARIAWGRIVL